MPDQRYDIVSTTVSVGGFTTLVAEFTGGGLGDTRNSADPSLVLAPCDRLSAALPAGTVEDRVKPEAQESLAAILPFLRGPGQFVAADLAGKALDAGAVGGETVSVDGVNGVTGDVTKMVTRDIARTKGIINLIESAILPEP